MAHPFVVHINPVAFGMGPWHAFGRTWGPLEVHWYGLMYLAGFLGAGLLAEHRRRQGRLPVSREALGDLMFYAMMGVILGGRLGYMLFGYFQDGVGDGLRWIWTEPQVLFKVWDGGMSFHGGLIGVVLACLWWSRRHRMHPFDVVDFCAPMVPIGLGLGRLGNFINGELWGKPTGVPWAMIFPGAHAADVQAAERDPALQALLAQYGGLPRHPSQLYELLLEGVAMFAVLWLVSLKPRPRYLISGLFGLLYGCFRFAVEFVRVPDAQLGYRAFGWLTKGQELSLPLIAIGLVLIAMAFRAGHRASGIGHR